MPIIKKSPSVLLLLATCYLLSIGPPALAQQVDIGEDFGSESFSSSVNLNNITLSYFINPIIFNIYIVSGLIFLGLLIFGGLTLIINAGSPEKISQGKTAITTSLVGYALIFASYWIIQIIQIITGINILNPGL